MNKKPILPKELDKLLQDKKSKVVCVDLRTEAEHDYAHIPGTVNIPLDQLKNHLSQLKGYDKVILYCASGARSQFACSVLPDNFKEKAESLEGGITKWENEGFKVIYKGKSRMPIMQQVFLIAGSSILLGLFFGVVTNNNWFFLIPMFMGLGLTFAGASGQCLMTKMLIKMPWNK